MIKTGKSDKVQGTFQFKEFAIEQDQCAMKVGTDGVLLGAWCPVDKVTKVLDIGMGSGLIAIMIAQRCTAEIHGIEIDEAAFIQAKANMEQTKWADRLKPIHQGIQNYARISRESYDLIVSNPPFFSGGTFSHNQDRNNVRHTVKLPHGDLLVAARKLLSPGGRFCVILPLIEGLRFQEIAKKYALYCTKITEVQSSDEGATERLLMQFEKNLVDVPEKDALSVYKANTKQYSNDYTALTNAFYLKM